MLGKLLCFLRRDHYPIDLKTLRCKICGKKFRIVNMSEYLDVIEENK